MDRKKSLTFKFQISGTSKEASKCIYDCRLRGLGRGAREEEFKD